MAALLGRAFADNPCYTWLFPRASRRDGDLRRYFAWRLRAGVGLTWVAVGEDDAPIGTATLEPPGGLPQTVPQLLWGWAIPTLVGPGPRALQRQFEASTAFSRQNRATAGVDAYWHVYAVAVDPDLQGGGVGSALLREVCAALDSPVLSPPAPAVLTTQRSENLPFYERFGFERRGELRIGEGGPEPFLSWSMARRGPLAPGS